jgi:hypothetical protein
MPKQSAKTAAKPSAKTAAKPSAKTAAKPSAKMTTAAIVNTTPRPRRRLIIKPTSLPSVQTTTDENPPPANSNSSNDPPLPVSVQEAGAAQQPPPQTASGPTQAPNSVTAEAATSTVWPDPALAKDSEDSSIAEKLADALGKLPSGQVSYTDSSIAEIDRLRKLEAAAKKQGLPEIKRPEGHIRDLQKAMGLEDERALYISCRVSESLFIYYQLT